MINMKNVQTESDLMREAARDVFWNIAYHDSELALANRKFAIVPELLVRCRCAFTANEAAEFFNQTEGDEGELLHTPDDFLKYWIGELQSGREYYEKELIEDYKRLTTIKMFIARGNYDDINLDELRIEQQKRVSE